MKTLKFQKNREGSLRHHRTQGLCDTKARNESAGCSVNSRGTQGGRISRSLTGGAGETPSLRHSGLARQVRGQARGLQRPGPADRCITSSLT